MAGSWPKKWDRSSSEPIQKLDCVPGVPCTVLPTKIRRMSTKRISELSDRERDELRLKLRQVELKLERRRREVLRQQRELSSELEHIEQRLRDIEHSHHALEPHFK
ncbi:hypothetical protein SEA_BOBBYDAZZLER_35 [Rhodococcus phage BobbyDazzler]|nr:hypothetical protein SEA_BOBBYDAZZLER_35 [Rhodococcus phage BobbyDazzler]